jgi:hypothetical protein
VGASSGMTMRTGVRWVSEKSGAQIAGVSDGGTDVEPDRGEKRSDAPPRPQGSAPHTERPETTTTRREPGAEDRP